jgi:hypothetical protein
MRHISDGELQLHVKWVTKRHRLETCKFVSKASIGRSVQQVADLLGESCEWVEDYLRHYAIEDARGGLKCSRGT